MIRIRLSITSVLFQGALLGGRYRVVARVEAGTSTTAESVSDPEQEFRPTRRHQRFETGLEGWIREVEVADATIVVRLEVLLFDARSGRQIQRLRHSWPAGRYYEHVSLYGDDFVVELASGIPGRAAVPPHEVVYERRHPEGYESRPTVAVAPPILVHAELDPVTPNPDRSNELVRPAFAEALGTRQWPLSHRHVDAAPSAVNPAVIAAWPGRGDPSRAWRNKWLSTFRLSKVFYRGASWSAIERDLVWSCTTSSGDADVRWVGGARGSTVTLWGTGSGEVRLDVAFRGERKTSIRALVRAPVTLRHRVWVAIPNLGPAHQQSYQRVAPGQDLDDLERFMRTMNRDRFRHLVIEANRYLRQVALELDDDFELTPKHHDFNLMFQADDQEAERTLWHHDEVHPEMITFSVIHSSSRNRWYGNAYWVPRSAAPAQNARTRGDAIVADVVDDGSPSTSWVSPNGVPPNMPAERQTMTFTHELRGRARSVGILLTRIQEIGVEEIRPSTIAHEVGHGLNLLHRHPEADGLPSYGNENLMVEGGGLNDIDRLQAEIIWQSEVVRRNAR